MRNAFGFALLNAISFQIIIGNPMILYAKSLEAGATVLGLIAGMLPLLNIFQIPAARHVDRVGHKRFVLAGWSTRVGFIFLMAVVPLSAGVLSVSTRLALILFLLFAFNLSRGISVCGWLPWITALIPRPLRGRYLAVEAAWVNVGSLLAFTLAAVVLGQAASPGRFAFLFFVSGLAGAASLYFLKRIPEARPPEATVSLSRQPVPWKAIAAYPPFRKLLWQSVTLNLATGGITAFVTAFMKVKLQMAEGTVLLVTATSFLGGLSSLGLLGERLDRVGSKPVLILFHGVWLAVLAALSGVAVRILPGHLAVLAGIQFLIGLSAASVQMAMMRLVMGTIPEMGRSHFFALYSVLSNLAGGVAPILWGVLIDLARGFEHPGHVPWADRYGLYFLAVFIVLVVSLVHTRRLEEPESLSTEEMLRDILTRSRLRAWLRLWPRA